jgi:hypothetical protein
MVGSDPGGKTVGVSVIVGVAVVVGVPVTGAGVQVWGRVFAGNIVGRISVLVHALPNMLKRAITTRQEIGSNNRGRFMNFHLQHESDWINQLLVPQKPTDIIFGF